MTAPKVMIRVTSSSDSTLLLTWNCSNSKILVAGREIEGISAMMMLIVAFYEWNVVLLDPPIDTDLRKRKCEQKSNDQKDMIGSDPFIQFRSAIPKDCNHGNRDESDHGSHSDMLSKNQRTLHFARFLHMKNTTIP